MDEPRICGTAMLAARAAATGFAVRRALRSFARGKTAEAEALLAQTLADWSDPMFGPTRTVAERAHAATLSALGRGDEARAIEAATEDKLAADARGHDHWIATGRDPMTVARTEAQRADIAFVLGDPELAERHLRSAIDRLAAHWGDDHLEVANFRDALVTLLLCRARTEEADALLARVHDVYAKGGYRYDTE